MAKHPILFRKAVRALRLSELGKPINHVMGLDATASGLQIMALLSGCVSTAYETNVAFQGNRKDVYQTITDEMNAHGVKITRKEVKIPVMTVFYGSKAQPKKIFGPNTPELFQFYDAVKTKLPGAFALMDTLQSHWRSDVEHHTWTLPDGHVAHVPVIKTVDKNLEIDEMNHIRVAYRASVLSKKARSRALAANIVHSIDGWIVRQMIAASRQQGFWMAPIHDCFYTHPNYMNQVRRNYVTILSWLAKNNILQSILTEISGRKSRYKPRKEGLELLVKNAEYALS
jgi:DNA-directed RNA polymerase